ncbi:MAG: hypothetical protein WBZ36_21985 [Candidatus Nitrosopolaris sp.]
MTFRQANDILNDRTLESKNMLTYIAEAPLVTVVDPPITVAKKLIVMSSESKNSGMGTRFNILIRKRKYHGCY